MDGLNKKRVDDESARAQDATDNDEISLEAALQEQESIGGVDSAIAETIDVMRSGRESVAQRFYQQEHPRSSEESSRPLDLIQAGRQRILGRIRQEPKGEAASMGESEVIEEMNRQLSEKLSLLTAHIPQDRVKRQMLEMEIQAVVKAYMNGVRRIMNPPRFTR